jgi:hypothetical protein
VSSDNVAPFGVDSIRVEGGFMFVGMSGAEEGIVKVYNLNAGGASHQLTGHKVRTQAAVGASVQPSALYQACVAWTEHSMHARHDLNIACMHAL